MQLDACIPNFLVQEHPGNPDDSDLGVGYITKPFVIKDGYIDIPTKPGLGIELNELSLQRLNLHRKLSSELKDLIDLSISLLKNIKGLKFLSNCEI